MNFNIATILRHNTGHFMHINVQLGVNLKTTCKCAVTNTKLQSISP